VGELPVGQKEIELGLRQPAVDTEPDYEDEVDDHENQGYQMMSFHTLFLLSLRALDVTNRT
jgi:hypothetical protein